MYTDRYLPDFVPLSLSRSLTAAAMGGRGGGGSSVGRGRDFLSGGHGFDPCSRCLLLSGWIGVSII